MLKELAALRPILERDGVVHLQLFGSRARGDNRTDSDVDVLIDVDRSRKFSLIDMAGVYNRILDATGLESSVVVRDDAPEEFVDRVLEEAVEVF
ncbi:MAG: nucleotidyltransferase domain-containing protein [Candidatus Devosia phytovorans]|uniref:Nucleotidyltransferase domain-containing protein n=1 Tax=Candidatus Devosia phytovorans TaxID=3121372 RepID=A0AAJ5VYL2_9HYPH|nr:nucleotidyltransferase domain-containing protein [Devosia sp.]WEK06255.1 MAG: nucleotidyltransferase domain-containing protein [Devosia sp.]